MRWQNGRLQIWNWGGREWRDFTCVAYADRLERMGIGQMRALEYDLFRLTENQDPGTVLVLPHHPPGWFAYQGLLKLGFELVKSETLEVEVLEDAAQGGDKP